MTLISSSLFCDTVISPLIQYSNILDDSREPFGNHENFSFSMRELFQLIVIAKA